MNYNLFIKYGIGGFNILNLAEDKLPIVVNAYKNGNYKFTIGGTEYNWGDLKVLKIFRNEASLSATNIEQYCQQDGGWIQVFGAGALVSPQFLERLGADVTDEFLDDRPFGADKKITDKNEAYINYERIDQLKNTKSLKFDLTKLVAICNELNGNWENANYFTVGLLLRTIINHVPPIFNKDFTTFAHVTANYGGQSFKKNMEYLNISMRSIADSYTHDLIRKKETLPTRQQVDFRANIDILLAEIIRFLG